jgi:hypothetical protein
VVVVLHGSPSQPLRGLRGRLAVGVQDDKLLLTLCAAGEGS